MNNRDEYLIDQLKDYPKEIIFAKVLSMSDSGKIDEVRFQEYLGENLNNPIIHNLDFEKKAIMERYPLLYSEEPRGGFYAPRGWICILDQCSNELEEINRKILKETGKHFVCNQIKEKFAELIIYLSEENIPDKFKEDISKIIYKYREKSLKTCELTGRDGAFLCNCSGWLHTLSEEALKVIGGEKVK